MTNGNNNTNNSDLLDYIKKFIIWLPLTIGLIILIPFLYISGWIEISSLLSLIVEYGPLFTFLAMVALVCVTAYYSSATKKIADSTETNVVIARRATETMEQTMWHQALIGIRKDYSSAEMTSALDTLWKFYRKCNDEKNDVNYLKEKYKERDEEEKNSDMKIEETLNYKRRIITHFYSYLAAIHRHNILPPEMIFDWWIPEDMEMIEKFIIPLQEAALEIHGVSSEKHIKFAMQPLEELKDACDSYFKKK